MTSTIRDDLIEEDLLPLNDLPDLSFLLEKNFPSFVNEPLVSSRPRFHPQLSMQTPALSWEGTDAKRYSDYSADGRKPSKKPRKVSATPQWSNPQALEETKLTAQRFPLKPASRVPRQVSIESSSSAWNACLQQEKWAAPPKMHPSALPPQWFDPQALEETKLTAQIFPSKPTSRVPRQVSIESSSSAWNAGSQQEKWAAPPKMHPSALHEACQSGHVTLTEVEDILRRDPTAAGRSIRLMAPSRQVYNHVARKVEETVLPERYQYPLHLAIRYQASPAVLERLVDAAPHILSIEEDSLHILLRHLPQDELTLQIFLSRNAQAAKWMDPKHNTALHMAILKGSSLAVVVRLIAANPSALSQKNFLWQRPLEVAQQLSVVCPENVAEFLQKVEEEPFV